MTNRLIFWLSLAGMILSLHLWIQKARGFDQGCFGLSKPTLVEPDGCREVSDLPASHLLGVSNSAWGYAFYFGVALLAFAQIVATPEWVRRSHIASEVAVTLALLYSIYLLGAMAVANSYCLLCLASTGLVTALFALHGVSRFRGRGLPSTEATRSRELAYASIGAFGASGLLVAVLLFVNRLGTRPLDQGIEGRELRRVVGRSLPYFIDGEKLYAMRACRMEWSIPPLDLHKFVGPTTPFIGKAGGVRVILFVDPNCPHCKEYITGFLQVAERLKDQARFAVLPRMIWEESAAQIAALKLAEGSEKYFALWQAMFDRQPGPHRSMTPLQIAELFRDLGLDVTNLDERIARLRPTVLGDAKVASAAGLDAVPLVYLEMRQVWRQNNSPECLAVLIDRVNSGVIRLR